MSKSRYYSDPRQISLKFDSICAETKKRLRKGEQAIYYPSCKSVFSLESKQAREFREWKYDLDVLGANY